MKNKRIILAAFALSVLILISCNLVTVLQPAPVVAANVTPIPATATPPDQPPQPILQATDPSQRVQVPSTPLPPAPTLVVSDPTPTATITVCDQAQLVSEGNQPVGTVFHSGDAVVKTWQVMNSGSCTWTTDYKVVFDHGYDFVSTRSVNLVKPVVPGQTVNIILTFHAPDPQGNYASYWNLEDPNGTIFGVGPNGSVPLSIRINVQSGPGPMPTAMK